MRKLLILLVLLIWAGPALAALTPNSYITAQTPQGPKVQIVNGTGVVTLTAITNFVTVYTGAANGSRLNSLICTSNDTASHNIAVGVIKSSTLYPLAVVAIGSASATSVTEANIISNGATNIPGLPLDSDGNPYLQLNTSDIIAVGVLTTAVTASDAVSCVANVSDF